MATNHHTAADLSGEHLNRQVTIAGRADENQWSVTGRLASVEHAASSPDEPGDPGLRETQLTFGVGAARITVGVEPDHAVTEEA
jgi:hypothetical protein